MHTAPPELIMVRTTRKAGPALRTEHPTLVINMTSGQHAIDAAREWATVNLGEVANVYFLHTYLSHGKYVRGLGDFTVIDAQQVAV